MTEELKPEAAPVEPVAWMYEPLRPAKGGFAEQPFAQFNRANMDPRYWTETPLYAHPPAAPTDALVEKVARLEEALEAVWKEATTMRNASKLVGPYPTNPADNRVWARSMYHAGKRIMEMLKPARAALAAMQEAGE